MPYYRAWLKHIQVYPVVIEAKSEGYASQIAHEVGNYKDPNQAIGREAGVHSVGFEYDEGNEPDEVSEIEWLEDEDPDVIYLLSEAANG